MSASQSTIPAAKTSVRRSTPLPAQLLGRHVRELALHLAVARDLHARRPPSRRRSRARARRRRRRRGRSAATRRGARCRAARPCSSFASCAACRPWSTPATTLAIDAEASPRCLACATLRSKPRERLAADVLHDEEELVGVARRRRASRTTFGCWMRAASRASSRNIATNSGSLRELRVQALDRDGAREARRAEQTSEVHGRHAAGRELAVERVAPNHPKRAGRGSDAPPFSGERMPSKSAFAIEQRPKSARSKRIQPETTPQGAPFRSSHRARKRARNASTARRPGASSSPLRATVPAPNPPNRRGFPRSWQASADDGARVPRGPAEKPLEVVSSR